MNSRQAKKARAEAWAEAKRRSLFSDLSGKVDNRYKPVGLWDRFMLAISKKRREELAKYKDTILSRWFKITVKDWSRQVYASVHDRDAIAFAKAREKMLRREVHIRMLKAVEKRKAAINKDEQRPSPFERM